MKCFDIFLSKCPDCSSTQSQWSGTYGIPSPLTIHQHWVADHTHSGFLSVHVQQLALQATAGGTEHLEHRGNCSGLCTNMGQTDGSGQLRVCKALKMQNTEVKKNQCLPIKATVTNTYPGCLGDDCFVEHKCILSWYCTVGILKFVWHKWQWG